MPQKRSPRTGQLNLSVELIERRIYLVRGMKVMLDYDLSELYQVPTKVLNQAVRRNASRFPEDFMFQLTADEAESLRSQIVTSNVSRGGRRYLPYAFTEHGVAMLSSVLKSARAVQMNIVIVRAFVRLREIVAGNRELARRLENVEGRLQRHSGAMSVLIDEIKLLKHTPAKTKRRIGFVNANN